MSDKLIGKQTAAAFNAALQAMDIDPSQLYIRGCAEVDHPELYNDNYQFKNAECEMIENGHDTHYFASGNDFAYYVNDWMKKNPYALLQNPFGSNLFLKPVSIHSYLLKTKPDDASVGLLYFNGIEKSWYFLQADQATRTDEEKAFLERASALFQDYCPNISSDPLTYAEILKGPQPELGLYELLSRRSDDDDPQSEKDLIDPYSLVSIGFNFKSASQINAPSLLKSLHHAVLKNHPAIEIPVVDLIGRTISESFNISTNSVVCYDPSLFSNYNGLEQGVRCFAIIQCPNGASWGGRLLFESRRSQDGISWRYFTKDGETLQGVYQPSPQGKEVREKLFHNLKEDAGPYQYSQDEDFVLYHNYRLSQVYTPAQLARLDQLMGRYSSFSTEERAEFDQLANMGLSKFVTLDAITGKGSNIGILKNMYHPDQHFADLVTHVSDCLDRKREGENSNSCGQVMKEPFELQIAHASLLYQYGGTGYSLKPWNFSLQAIENLQGEHLRGSEIPDSSFSNKSFVEQTFEEKMKLGEQDADYAVRLLNNLTRKNPLFCRGDKFERIQALARKAIPVYAARAEHSHSTKAWFQYADLLEWNGDLDKAEHAFNEVLKLQPKHQEALKGTLRIKLQKLENH